MGLSSTCAGGALLDDHALVHEHDLVADLAGEADLVGDDDHRHPLGGELAHHVEDLLDQLGVERAGDLVEQHHVRVHRQRAGDRDPLLLAAGEAVGVLVELVGEADPVEQRLGLLRASSSLRPSTFSWASETFSSAVLCGNRLNCWKTIPTRRRTKSSRPSVALAVAGDLLALEQDPALLGRLEQVDAAQQGHLPEPLGPSTQTTSPRSTSRSTPRSTWSVAEALVDALELQHRAVGAAAAGVAVGGSVATLARAIPVADRAGPPRRRLGLAPAGGRSASRPGGPAGS